MSNQQQGLNLVPFSANAMEQCVDRTGVEFRNRLHWTPPAACLCGQPHRIESTDGRRGQNLLWPGRNLTPGILIITPAQWTLGVITWTKVCLTGVTGSVLSR